MKMVLGGLVGGLIGAAIWAGVVYFTEYEIGWIAIGIGFLTGLGVRFGTDESSDRMLPGIISVVIAMGSIVLAKYLAVLFMVSGVMSGNQITIDDNVMVARYASEIVQKKESDGEKINWPPGHDLEGTPAERSYPQDIWDDALKRWTKIPANEKEAMKTKAQEEIDEVMAGLTTSIQGSAFKESFDGMDILFFLIAAYTAFNTSSGSSDD